jgi:hypothetical protein
MEYNFLSRYSMINTTDCKIFRTNQQILVMFNYNIKQYTPKTISVRSWHKIIGVFCSIHVFN